MAKKIVRRVRLAPLATLSGGPKSLALAAVRAGFEVMAIRVLETEQTSVSGAHPERGTFTATWVAGKNTEARYEPREVEWRMVPDFRTRDAMVPGVRDPSKLVKNTNKKPLGIGLERPVRNGGSVTVTALRAWVVA